MQIINIFRKNISKKITFIIILIVFVLTASIIENNRIRTDSIIAGNVDFTYSKGNSILVEDVKEKENIIRSGEYEDYDDTTGFSNALNLTSGSVNAIFNSNSDYDYYYFNPTNSKVMYIEIYNLSASCNPIIWIYDSSFNLISSYYNNITKDDNFYANNVVFVESYDIVYVKVTSSSAAIYTINANTTFNPSGINTVLSSFDGVFASNVSSIHYNMNSTMNSIVYNTSYTYLQIFNEALQIWRNVGLDVVLSTSSGDVQIDVSTVTYNTLNPTPVPYPTVAQTLNSVVTTGWFIKKYYYNPVGIEIINDMSYFASASYGQANQYNMTNSEAIHYYLLNAIVHEIGHTLGLTHTDKVYNVMYQYCTIYRALGDGDINSVLSIW